MKELDTLNCDLFDQEIRKIVFCFNNCFWLSQENIFLVIVFEKYVPMQTNHSVYIGNQSKSISLKSVSVNS